MVPSPTLGFRHIINTFSTFPSLSFKNRPFNLAIYSITAGGLVEPFTDDQSEKLFIDGIEDRSDRYALRVTGDSMIEDFITEGDFAIMKPVAEPERVKNGTIVAARVEGYGTTLKHFHLEDNIVVLKPANANYAPIRAYPSDVQIQGVLVGVWRNYG